jgi:Flp pilus assembly pilin Flp
MKSLNKNAQTMVEYAILFIVVAGALFAMKTFVGRALHERYRQSADVFGGGDQYVKNETNVTLTNPTLGYYSVVDPTGVGDPCVAALRQVADIDKEVANLTISLELITNDLNNTDAQAGVLTDSNTTLLKQNIGEILGYVQSGEGPFVRMQRLSKRIAQFEADTTVNATNAQTELNERAGRIAGTDESIVARLGSYAAILWELIVDRGVRSEAIMNNNSDCFVVPAAP